LNKNNEDLQNAYDQLSKENSMFKTNNRETMKSKQSSDHNIIELQKELDLAYNKLDLMDAEIGRLRQEKDDIEKELLNANEQVNNERFNNRFNSSNYDDN